MNREEFRAVHETMGDYAPKFDYGDWILLHFDRIKQALRICAGLDPEFVVISRDLVKRHDSATDDDPVMKPLLPTHQYKPHPKYPWFCKECGYPEHEKLKHTQVNEKEGAE